MEQTNQAGRELVLEVTSSIKKLSAIFRELKSQGLLNIGLSACERPLTKKEFIEVYKCRLISVYEGDVLCGVFYLDKKDYNSVWLHYIIVNKKFRTILKNSKAILKYLSDISESKVFIGVTPNELSNKFSLLVGFKNHIKIDRYYYDAPAFLSTLTLED